MPADHITQWHHNRAFLGTVRPDYPDWAVTACFYAALHAVDALLKHDKVTRVVSHETRNATLTTTNRYARIWRLYQPLYSLARTVRYMARPQDWVPWPQIEAEVLRRYLYPLETSVLKLMGKPEPMPAIQLAGPRRPTEPPPKTDA